MMTLKNKEEVLAALIEQLKEFEISLNKYQTDVYLYIDEDGNGSIDTFVNVGGNSWTNDNHFTIYCDREHNNTMMDQLIDGTSYRWLIEELEAHCNLSGIEKETFDALTSELDEDERNEILSIDDLEVYEVEQYLLENYGDEIKKYYSESFVPDSCAEYIGETAYNALDDFLETYAYFVFNNGKFTGKYSDIDEAKNAAKNLEDPEITIEDENAYYTY